MTDVFDQKIICKKCNEEMNREDTVRNGFRIRNLRCNDCGDRIQHPGDIAEYQHFIQLKNKTFKVKLRLVGNSYAVSIPKEIINFIQEGEKIMDDMVRMCFDNARRLNITFGKELI